MKKAQGLSMQTIVIIIIAIIILAALVILFFTQFGANKKNFGNFSEVGSNKTEDAVSAASEFSPLKETHTTQAKEIISNESLYLFSTLAEA